MKQRYRIADLIIQLAMLLTWLIVVVKNYEFALNMYFIVGGWFLVSLVIHRLIDKDKDSAYNIFLVIVAGIIASFVLSITVASTFFIVLYILFFGAPVMALLYTYVCFTEIRKLNKRPISLLK